MSVRTHSNSYVLDVEPLTPAHLLYGRRIITPLYHELHDDITEAYNRGDNSGISKRTKNQQRLINHFRERWTREYLTRRREYHTATGNNNQNLNIGDVDLIQDEGPCIRWRLAVIEELAPGNDGLVRSVNLRTNGGFTNRPIRKPLNVTENDTIYEYPMKMRV